MIQLDVDFMDETKWILRFGELGLKSKTVRGAFQRSLMDNLLEQALKLNVQIFVEKQRSQYHLYSDSDSGEVEKLLSFVLGIVAVDKVKKLNCNYDPKSIAECVLSSSNNLGKKRTFGVRVKRMYKYGYISSKDYERIVGQEMIDKDSELSVDLNDPDEWIKLIIGSNGVSRIVKRIDGSGGLPTGVQGDVLVNLTSEKVMLESYLIMRRGVRLIPVLSSKQEFIEKLSRFDPFIGDRTNERFRYKKSHKRPAWGVLGMSIEESIPFIGQREDAVKTTPVSTLSPLDGWTKLEIKNLKNHFEKPSKYRFHEDTRSWQF